MTLKLNPEQKSALTALQKDGNIFLTGAAGSGKSFLIKAFLKEYHQENPDDKKIPILASTGAAAILVGGRTFHSFFGLGIMEGGLQKTVERALKNARLVKRLKTTDTVIIDEVSMLSGPTLQAAECIARKARVSLAPWGGLRIIAVGDFAQLPPVNPFSQKKEWAFLDSVWENTEFQTIYLKKSMRSTDLEFNRILNSIRLGHLTPEVEAFLNERTTPSSETELTCLFPHRESVERFNLEKLESIKSPSVSFQTIYVGKEKDIEQFRKNSPIADVIQLKESALIMIRQNDPEGRYVNGSLGHILKISDDALKIKLLTGRTIEMEKMEFTLLNAEGEPVVTARNFPVSLAWAMTIHKAQGTTLDQVRVDLRKLWEPGQAYVALSRARSPQGLWLEGWNPRSIFAAPEVTQFHQEFNS